MHVKFNKPPVQEANTTDEAYNGLDQVPSWRSTTFSNAAGSADRL